MSGMKSFAFLACDDVSGRTVVQRGEPAARVCYYKMVTGDEQRFYVFWLGGDGRVADYMSYTV